MIQTLKFHFRRLNVGEKRDNRLHHDLEVGLRASHYLQLSSPICSLLLLIISVLCHSVEANGNVELYCELIAKLCRQTNTITTFDLWQLMQQA
jgi:hypothetical protein